MPSKTYVLVFILILAFYLILSALRKISESKESSGGWKILVGVVLLYVFSYIFREPHMKMHWSRENISFLFFWNFPSFLALIVTFFIQKRFSFVQFIDKLLLPIFGSWYLIMYITSGIIFPFIIHQTGVAHRAVIAFSSGIAVFIISIPITFKKIK